MPFKIFHFYKIYTQDIEGGVPTVIFSLTRRSPDDVYHCVVTARRCGWSRKFVADGLPVEAVSSFGTLFSTPLAVGYISAFVRRVRSASVAVHHAPFPLTDLAIQLGLPAEIPLRN
jgi:hypothetical protein